MDTGTLKYTVIGDERQYQHYCALLDNLLGQQNAELLQDEIDLLTLLIEKYDEDHNNFQNADPIALLRSLIQDHQLKAQDLTSILGVSKGYISDILNYKKGLSKEIIRKLAAHFKLRQEAFNRPYPLIPTIKKSLRVGA